MRKLEAVIFDWAGTTVDHGSLAPVKAVTEVFARNGIAISDAEARLDMGIYKKDHIRKILSLKLGKAANEADVEELFRQFVPLQFAVLERYSGLIQGVRETVGRLAASGLKIAANTGYTRPMLEILEAAAAKEGYRPALSLCPDDVNGGRPHPWMCWRIALELRLSAAACAVKVGDTVSDIEEARNAGMWAVGVVDTGNEVGLSAEGLAALGPAEREQKLSEARERLAGAGAHYLIAGVWAIEPAIDQINSRLAAGEGPWRD